MNHKPRKRFGQNFLHDQGVLQKIDHAIRPKLTDHIVEIALGLGALSERLIDGAGRIDAVELDRDLIEPLKIKFGEKITIPAQSTRASSIRQVPLLVDIPNFLLN